MMTDPSGTAHVPNTEAVIDTALTTVRAYDLSTIPDLNDVEMATAIGQLTATLTMLLAAFGHRAATAG